MKRTAKNIEILEALGFKDTGNDWFRFEDGWTFNLITIKNFKELFQRYKASHCKEALSLLGVESKLEKLKANIEDLGIDLQKTGSQLEKLGSE